MAITDDIRGMSDADLRARVLELEEERFRLKFRAATETLEQPLRLRSVRRDIARILTLLRQREIAAAPPSSRTATPTERRRKNRREGKAAERAAERAHNRANRKRPSAVRRPKGSGATAAGTTGAKRVTSPSAGQAAATT
ncbi:MAG: 50S ribosomal protein L29 [Candidatus Eremiobacteraeota bacterium]|nr:50S ribosomal protein L29 [Candidatus Eremiobacteraeota bacterium]